MIRTTVYLDEDDKRRLAALAAAEGTTEAELIRQGVRLVVQQRRQRPRAPYGTSSDGRTARETDQLLADTGFGE
jgi:Ribbon-helix-helix protein, copG family